MVLLIMPLTGFAQTLTHRYSIFNEPNGSTTITDVVASANGALHGTAAITGGQLVLNGMSGNYASLPGGLITGYSAVTVEAWADYGTLPVNCYLFSFGNTDGANGEDYIFCAPQRARITISGVDPGYNSEQNAICGSWSGMNNLHVVAIFNPPSGYLAIYTNGVLAVMNNAETVKLSSVNNVLSYIGRSLYTADPYAPIKVDEFRIYNGPLSAQQIALDAATGPAQIITNAGALQSVQLAVTNMAAGGTQQALFTGNFLNVSNVNLFTYGSPVITTDNSNVLNVTSSGLISAIIPGATANVIASYGGLSVTQSVTVAGFATNQFVFDSFNDGYWTIINQGNNNALVVNSLRSTQETFTNGATEQQFQLLYNLKNSTFRIRQRSSWNWLAPNSAVPGAAVPWAASYTGASVQQWHLVSAGGGYYRIFNAASNLVLQTDNGSPAIVTLAAPSTSPYQLWQINYQTHYFKKGTAGYEGPPYSTELTTSWAYNYDDNTGSTLPARFAYIPMIDTKYWEPVSDLQSRDAGWIISAQQVYLLGYNEPDNTGSASTNPSTNDAIATWPSLMALNIPLVSPATQNTEDTWENSFFQMIAANNYRVDYTAVHEYVPPNAASLISTLRNVYNAYGHPIWLTEFSPVDWGGTAGWTEDDDYNFLAEFMWQAEGQDWFRRYSIFPFTGTNHLPPYQSTTAGYRGNFFLTGSTLSPYGELYATWDGDLTLHAQTPYIIHNLGTSFRLTATNSTSTPKSSTIYVRNATTEWALLAAPDSNWYVISLNDGRRLSNTNGVLSLAPIGTVGTNVEWTLNGPDGSGYYFIGDTAGTHNLNGAGTAPAITFSEVSAVQNNNTRWRFIKPYQPVTINTNATTPVNPSVTAVSASITLGWSGAGGAPYFNVYRGNVSGGSYSRIATALKQSSYLDSSVSSGVSYYYVVTAMNALGVESASSTEVAVNFTNTPPVISSIADYATNENTVTVPIAFTISDAETPASALTLTGASSNTSLVPNANIVFGGGAGNPTITLTPAANQFGNSTITVTVGDGATNTSTTFNLTINQVHYAPQLSPIADATVYWLNPLIITNSATSTYAPPLALTFSLDAGAPAGAAIDPVAGVFTWTPDSTYANTTNNITVMVTDNGTPPMSDARSFSITVMPPPVIQGLAISNSMVMLTWSAMAGQGYRLQFKNHLGDTNWTDVPGDIWATGTSATTTNTFDITQPQFYRVMVLPPR